MMKRTGFLGWLLWVGCGAVAVASAVERPHFVFVIADDITPEDMGVYGGPVPTPNAARLAASGMLFHNAYITTSSCSPSRCSIITSRYPHNTGAPELHMPLPPDQWKFPGRLRKAGYHSVLNGKNHMTFDGRRDAPELLKDAFDEIEEGGRPSGAEQWVDVMRRRPKDKPFFFWFASHDAHRDWQFNELAPRFDPADVVVPPYLYDGLVTREDLAGYYHEVARVDYYLGLLMDEVERQGIAEATYIMFCSDNGRPFPRCKTRLYDSGVKTPLIVAGGEESPDSAVSVPQAARPNVVLVFVDDLGWPDLSAFGEDRVRTPAIDRLASEGIVFEQFYVNSPICSPSRVAISTGQYPQRWNITSYLGSAANNRRRGMADWLDPRAPMLPRILQAAGYATGHFGKWHMGGQRDVDAAPPITDYGFDESLTNFEGMGPKLLPLTMRPGWDEPRKIWEDAERLGGPVQWRMRSTITGGFVDAAMDFIARAEASGKPFYVNLWPDDVHGPWFPSVANWRGKTPDNYRAVLEEMDAQFAPLFDYIRGRPYLRDNTLILLCSDNGADPKTIDRRPWPLRGCKGTLYEGGIRSPLIVWGPGRIANGRAGSRNATSLLTAMDLVPSLLRLAGVDAPENVEFDGQDLLDTLLGRTADSRLAPVFFGRPPDFKEFAGMADLPDLAMREDRWKLLCNADGSQIELFDVETDPTESRNLADSMPIRARATAKRAVEWNQAIAP